jgi:hypothetical protein
LAGIKRRFDEFYNDKSTIDGLSCWCKNCKKGNAKQYQANNPEQSKIYKQAYYSAPENLQRKKESDRIWRTENKERKARTDKQYAEDNKEKVSEYQKQYRQEHKEEIGIYHKDRYNNDTNYKLARLLRSRLTKAINRNQKGGSAVNDLGCPVDELRLHLESLFKPGMNWENWSLDGWHIDHIIPLASFDLTDREQFLKACHYTNLQPLWAEDNLSKSDKIIEQPIGALK